MSVEKSRDEASCLVPHAKALDKLYVPTRYPNGLPDLTPFEVFTESDACSAIRTASEVVETIAALMDQS